MGQLSSITWCWLIIFFPEPGVIQAQARFWDIETSDGTVLYPKMQIGPEPISSMRRGCIESLYSNCIQQNKIVCAEAGQC